MATPTQTIANAQARVSHRGLSLRAKAAILRWATVVAVVLVWEVAAAGPLAGNPYLSPPSVVATEGLQGILTPDALFQLGNTTLRFLEAFLIVVVAGVPLGLLLGRLSRGSFAGSRDVVSILYALPMVPFYPLLVLWLGLGAPSEVAFGVIHGIVPVVLIVMTASNVVRPDLLTSAQVMGAGSGQRLLWVVLPATLPEVVGALKIGASLTMLGVLLAELMISVDGIGSFITQQITNHQGARLDAMIVVVCIGVVVINTLLSALERRLAHGQDSQSQ
nr:ABC transporter permease subunit [Microbacterium bovistercoris]